MLGRRGLILGAAGAGLATPVCASTTVVAQTKRGPLQSAFVQRPAIIRQQCAHWCWAASAAMIFAMHGRHVDQLSIVNRVFGAPRCAPTEPVAVSEVLSTAWIDARGETFRSHLVAAYDVTRRVSAINNQIIVRELASNRPLLYGNRDHAMVVGQADYIDTPAGPDITSVTVFDPWPFDPPVRRLSPGEMIPAHLGGEMTFLAAVHVG